MKHNIKKPVIISAFLIGGLMVLPVKSAAQKFSIKPNVNIGVGNPMNVKSDIKEISTSSSDVDFGVDFGYTFWKKGGNRLEVSLGLGYSAVGLKLGVPDLSYNYIAPASADEDGNTYVRYYDLSDMEQKLSIGYFNIPVYLTYGYQFSKRIGVHADLGFRMGFKCSASLKRVSGSATSYGVFPDYGNLVITDSYLDGFGISDLSAAKRMEPEANSFNASLLVGAAVDVYIAGPVWFNIGVRYNCGFTDCFKHNYDGNAFTADTAPVTYTVAEGEKVRPLTCFLSSSKLSPFSIYMGFTINL